jgi:hypothetical protein
LGLPNNSTGILGNGIIDIIITVEKYHAVSTFFSFSLFSLSILQTGGGGATQRV